MNLEFYESTGWSKRLINYLIDFIIIIIVFIVTIKMIPSLFKHLAIELTFDLNAILAIFYVLYYLIFESINGRTIGKYLTGTKVIAEDGRKPKFSQILLRTLMRLLIIELFSYLSKRPDGWHDSVSNTQVIDIKEFKNKYLVSE